MSAKSMKKASLKVTSRKVLGTLNKWLDACNFDPDIKKRLDLNLSYVKELPGHSGHMYNIVISIKSGKFLDSMEMRERGDSPYWRCEGLIDYRDLQCANLVKVL